MEQYPSNKNEIDETNELRDAVLERAYSEDLHIEQVETGEIQEIIDSTQLAAAALSPEWFGVDEKNGTPRIIVESPFEAVLVRQALKATQKDDICKIITTASMLTNQQKSPLRTEIALGIEKIRDIKFPNS